MNPVTLARLESIVRPLVVKLPSAFVVRKYSHGRADFLEQLSQERPQPYQPPADLGMKLWGIPFRAPLMNAAGMFKNGGGYELMLRQGAGAYLAGTTTALPRTGNERNGTRHPFAPYPQSGAASNWMGLPNNGHAAVAAVLARFERVAGFPIGASLSADPQQQGEKALQDLVSGLEAYEQAGVDFLEINESCPNTEAESAGIEALSARLQYLRDNFLSRRQRNLPVIVKFSTDTNPSDVARLIHMLLELDFDGVNFGNTSTRYAEHRKAIVSAERKLYDYFNRTFGGGLSGTLLKADSLALSQSAAAMVEAARPGREFHVLRTGGVEKSEDIQHARAAGVPLCQWYTGYFERFTDAGHDLYRRMFE